jgi:hypothetical protein
MAPKLQVQNGNSPEKSKNQPKTPEKNTSPKKSKLGRFLKRSLLLALTGGTWATAYYQYNKRQHENQDYFGKEISIKQNAVSANEIEYDMGFVSDNTEWGGDTLSLAALLDANGIDQNLKNKLIPLLISTYQTEDALKAEWRLAPDFVDMVAEDIPQIMKTWSVSRFQIQNQFVKDVDEYLKGRYPMFHDSYLSTIANFKVFNPSGELVSIAELLNMTPEECVKWLQNGSITPGNWDFAVSLAVTVATYMTFLQIEEDEVQNINTSRIYDAFYTPFENKNLVDDPEYQKLDSINNELWELDSLLIDKKFSLDSLDTIISDIENSIKSKTTELNTCKNEITNLEKIKKRTKKQNSKLQQLRTTKKKLESEIKILNTKKAKMLKPQQTIKDEYKQLSDSTTKVEKAYNQGIKQFDSERAYLDENTLEVIKDIYKQLIPGKLAGLWQTWFQAAPETKKFFDGNVAIAVYNHMNDSTHQIPTISSEFGEKSKQKYEPYYNSFKDTITGRTITNPYKHIVATLWWKKISSYSEKEFQLLQDLASTSEEAFFFYTNLLLSFDRKLDKSTPQHAKIQELYNKWIMQRDKSAKQKLLSFMWDKETFQNVFGGKANFQIFIKHYAVPYLVGATIVGRDIPSFLPEDFDNQTKTKYPWDKIVNKFKNWKNTLLKHWADIQLDPIDMPLLRQPK